MKKRLIITTAITVMLFVVIWLLVSRRAGIYTVRQGIPADAVFVVEIPSFNSIHEKLNGNKIWTSLKDYPYFGDYSANLNLADSLCNAYPLLRKWLTDRPFAISCHVVKATGYDFLYVCDLGKLNVIQAFDGIVGKVVGKGKIRKTGELTEIVLENTKLYYGIKANLLFLSLSPELAEQGMRACACSHEEANLNLSGDMTLDLNHRRLEKLLAIILAGKEEATDSSVFKNTVLALNLKDKALYFKGKTYPNRSSFPLLSALNLIDGAASGVNEIMGEHVAGYVSVCFSSFTELERILLEEYQVNHLKKYGEYERTLTRLNKYLGVDIATLFTSWIGTEISVIKPAVDKENRLDNLVLAVKSKDIDLAKDQLGYLTEQISRKTPVRFRELDYNGYKISYLSLKGFFKLFLGPLFRKFDRPYYTFIGDYVVFSNSSSTLANMIKDYSLGNTLVHDEKYNAVMSRLGSKNNIYGYVSSPEMYEYVLHALKPESRTELLKNKGAFLSLEAVGFSMLNAGSAYETQIIATHNVSAEEEYQVRELNRELVDLADRIESGYYRVVIPDSIAISTRGDFSYSTEELSWSGKLSNGDPAGIWNIKNRQGQLIAQYIYREGKPDGAARFFYPDGVVMAQVVYDAGKIKSYEEFFSDGTLKATLEYNKGIRHGDAHFYYSTGHLFGEGKYKKGKRTGTWKYYRVTGELEKKQRL